jgi:hypothetical protein
MQSSGIGIKTTGPTRNNGSTATNQIVCPGQQADNFKAMRLLKLYIIFCCLVVSLLFALRLLEAWWWQSKEQSHVAVSATSFAGCYELKLGRWWPWSFGGDNEFVTPPSKIELLAIQGTEGFETEGFLIRGIPPSQGNTIGRRRASFWQAKSKNDVGLTWTTGFSGVTLNLSRHGNDLRGWAHPFFDFPTSPRIMHVTAQRIPCGAPSSSDAGTTDATTDTNSRSGKLLAESIFGGSLVAIIVGYLLASRSKRTLLRTIGSMMVAAIAGFVGLVMLWWVFGFVMPFPPPDVSSVWEELTFLAIFSVLPFGAFYISAKFIRLATKPAIPR